MKKILPYTLFLILFAASAFAQMPHPVKWEFSMENNKKEALLKFTADIEKSWHIYSQFTADGGPLPMLFTYDSLACYKLIDKVTEPKPIESYDDVFAITVKYHEGKPLLTQKVEILKTPCKISGRIDYQACKEMCIGLDTTFTFMVK